MGDEKLNNYRNNMIVMSLVGAWPYQSRASTCAAYFVYFLVAGSQFYCKIAYIKLKWPDPVVFIECIIPVAVDLMSAVRLGNLLINSSTMKRMFDEMMKPDDWLPESREAAIMDSYIRRVQKMTVIWTCYLYTTVVLYNLMPLLPQILGTLGNNTRELPVHAYYHTDTDDHYYLVFTHGFLTGLIFTTGIIAADTSYVLYVHYACALFAVLGYRLENAVTESDEYSATDPRKCDDVTYKNFSDCIDQHSKAIEFSELVESAHKLSFLLSVGINMLIISVVGAQMVHNLNEIHLLFRQGAMIACLMSHLFIENYYAQQLLDHSLTAYTNILECKWYRASLRTKELLILFVSRSSEPNVLTIGGLYVMSMENFSWVLRTSASYFTILLSLQ